jgi:hypothetical protein
MVTIQEAEERWEVSGRTIRRRLSKGVSGASRTPNGQWLIPTSWLDQEYGGASSATTVNEPVIDSVIDTPEPVIDTPMTPEGRISARVIAEETAAEMAKQRAEADEIRERRAAARQAREGAVIDSVIDMTPPVSYDNRPDMSSQLEAKDARIDHLRDQIADLRVEMAGITVEQRYAQIAEKRVTAERDRANSDLEQARSEAERLRIDLTGEQAARTAEAAAAEAMTADKDQEIERLRGKMSEVRKDLATSRGEARRKYRRQRRKDQKRAARAKRKTGE